MTGRVEEAVRDAAARVATAAGVELYDVAFGRHGNRWVLTVYIDRAGGRIDLGDCQAVSEQLGAELEVADPIPHGYTLEVSSPGMDRILRRASHWEGAVGSRVRFALREAREGRRRFRGRVVRVEGDEVLVRVDEGGSESFRIEEVDSARVEPEF